MATEKIVEIDLKNIRADFNWNGRYVGDDPSNPVWAQDSGSEDDTNDFTMLKQSMADRGQDTPVIVRPYGKQGKFDLTSGFRRYLAASQLEWPKIKAIVREHDDLQALLANVRENTERQSFRPADQAFKLSQVKAAYEKSKVDFTQASLGADFGVSQTYVSRMLKIVDGLSPKIFDAWRALPKALNFNSVVDVATLPKGEQAEAWAKLVAGSSSEEPTEAQKKAKKVEGLCSKAETFGTFLGRLAHNELILETEDFSWPTAIELAVKFPGGKSALTARQKTKIANAAKLAYIKAKEGQAEPGQADDESEE